MKWKIFSDFQWMSSWKLLQYIPEIVVESHRNNRPRKEIPDMKKVFQHFWMTKWKFLNTEGHLTQRVPASIARAYVRAESMFLVKIPPAKPYEVLLARSITSSRVLNFRIDWTGPKIYVNKQHYFQYYANHFDGE